MKAMANPYFLQRSIKKMKKIILILMALTLFLAVSASAENAVVPEANADLLGKPLPDYEVTDIDGNTFSIPKALEDHEAVVINLWATWCNPCKKEFPDINKVYEAYKDKVAFIALSTEPDDTPERIAEFRENFKLTLPMGRDKDNALYLYTGGNGVPTTLIVDRFGNLGFIRIGAFRTADDLSRTLDTFLGDQYTETVVQKDIPADTSTLALPVSPVRALYIDNPGIQKALVRSAPDSDPVTFYVVNDSVAHIRVEITAADAAGDVILHSSEENFTKLQDMYDPERGVMARDVAVPEDGFSVVALLDFTTVVSGNEDPDMIQCYLVRSTDDIQSFMDMLITNGYTEASCELLSDEAADNANAAEAYVIHVLDQNGDPVPEVIVNFCTDTACVPCESDETGTITYDGALNAYHVQIVDCPEGYTCDESFEMYTPKESYGEWTIRILKD